MKGRRRRFKKPLAHVQNRSVNDSQAACLFVNHGCLQLSTANKVREEGAVYPSMVLDVFSSCQEQGP